jgi:hypothetical protein
MLLASDAGRVGGHRGISCADMCQALRVPTGQGQTATDVLTGFASLRQHQRDGKRSPHKPLLVLLALGRLNPQAVGRRSIVKMTALSAEIMVKPRCW